MVKQRFSTLDILATIANLRERLLGLRVTNVYDIDNKTYLFKLAKPGLKQVVLIESGIRFHSTEFDWPKNNTPSGFSMKLRKHLRTRRLNKIEQLGVDRVIDLEFGSGEACFHVIVELYDRGNMILTDHEYTILSLLRVRTVDEDVKFAVGEKFPLTFVKEAPLPTQEEFIATLQSYSPNDPLKKALNIALAFGPAVVEHCILTAGMRPDGKIATEINYSAENTEPVQRLYRSVLEAGKLMKDISTSKSVKGYIIQKKETRSVANLKKDDDSTASTSSGATSTNPNEILIYDEYHPFLFEQHKHKDFIEFESFDAAVDEFYSRIEGQKMDMKAIGAEKNVLKKLEKFKTEHQHKIESLKKSQEEDALKGHLIEVNREKVENALLVIRSALAHAVDWSEINDMVEGAKERGDPIASIIHKLKLDSNHITLLLTDPYDEYEEDNDDNLEEHNDNNDNEADNNSSGKQQQLTDEQIALEKEKEKGKGKGKKHINPNQAKGKAKSKKNKEDNNANTSSSTAEESSGRKKKKGVKVEIDVNLTALANARIYFNKMRHAAAKEQRTIDASSKALKSAERQTKQQLKQVSVKATISKVRKPIWFEKFYWFISSENYLVIGGRDMQQNEMLVKKHLRRGDAYVHADLHGASSVIVKNNNPDAPIPIRTLCEAGQMAVCYSAAWDAKVVTSAWWVYDHQVSKTAPTGEYLTTGSFMIRGKKNFLPPAPLILGFGFMYKLDESCIAKHLQERRVVSTAEETEESKESEKSSLEEQLQEQIQAKLESEGLFNNDESDGEEEGEGEREEKEKEDDNNNSSSGSGSGNGPKMFQSSDGDEAGPDEGSNDDDSSSNSSSEEEAAASNNAFEFPDTVIDIKIGTPSVSSTPAVTTPAQDLSNGPNFGANTKSVSFNNKSIDRYLVSAPGDFEEGEENTNQNTASSKKYVTAKQRRDLKKGIKQQSSLSSSIPNSSSGAYNSSGASSPAPMSSANMSAADEASDSDNESNKSSSSSRTNNNKGNAKPGDKPSAAPSKPIPRGKRGKIKKMKEKYADQDEEERRIRMDLLASAGKEAKGKEKEKEKEKEKPKGKEQGNKKGPTKANSKPQNILPTPSTSTTNEKDKENDDAGAVPGAGVDEEEGDQDEIKQLLAEENVTLLDEEEKDQLSLLDTLTGKPLDDDVLLFAIPVCAPYSAIASYKHKVKVVPGTSRKGKAAKSALEVMIRMPTTVAREKDLMRACKDTEIALNLPKNIKIGGPSSSTKK